MVSGFRGLGFRVEGKVQGYHAASPSGPAFLWVTSVNIIKLEA